MCYPTDMCGIYGIVGAKSSRKILAQMGKTLRQRGPDDQGEHIKGEAALGATRLSIIDLPGGDQPLFNEDKSIWSVQNGELYNYQDLMQDMRKRGHKFRSQSDTEVYNHLYEDHGLGFVKKLRGMYSIGLWDEKRKKLVLVRDRLGIKPLYYARLGTGLVFASELKAILKTGIKVTLNNQAMHDYLSVNYVPGSQTIFNQIKKLPPGHTLVWQKGKVRTKRYWSPPEDSNKTSVSETELKTQLMELLEEAVKYHLVSDVPVGAFLSGGIDSSVVVALASKLYPKTFRTFAVGFEHKSYSELRFASQIARKFGTSHEEISLRLKPLELVEKIGGYFDEPFGDSSAVAVYAISQVAHKAGMKVVLTGDGGDEVFGGYVTYQGDQLLRLYNRLPHLVREKVIKGLVKKLPASHSKMSLDFKAKRFIRGASHDPLKAHFLWKAIFTDEQIGSLLSNKQGKPTERLWREIFDSMDSNKDTLNKLMATDLQTSLVDDMLTKVDRMSMAHSLEVRVPLLDHKLVEFMARLPSQYKLRRFTLKYLLKQTLRGLLPNEILDRPKAGFHVPVAHWIKSELKDLIGDYLSPMALKKQGYFDPKFVQELIKDHNSLKADHSREIWGLLMFSIWREKYLQ